MSELRSRRIGESSGSIVKPLIDLFLRGEGLVDVARLITQIQDDIVFNGFVILVGMDVGTEGFNAALFVAFQQGCACETDQHCVGEQCLHRSVKFPRLRAVALVDKDEKFTTRLETIRQMFLNVVKVVVIIVGIGIFIFYLTGSAELVDE